MASHPNRRKLYGKYVRRPRPLDGVHVPKLCLCARSHEWSIPNRLCVDIATLSIDIYQ